MTRGPPKITNSPVEKAHLLCELHMIDLWDGPSWWTCHQLVILLNGIQCGSCFILVTVGWNYLCL